MLLPRQRAKLARGAKDKEQAMSQTPNTANNRHLRLLRVGGQRPSSRRAADKRDELAPLQLIELHAPLEFAVIGIDIGKNSFHVVGHDARGAIVLRQKWSRCQVECPLGVLAV